jgi:hypothetical protein
MGKCTPDCSECGGRGEVQLFTSTRPCSRLSNAGLSATGGPVTGRLSFIREADLQQMPKNPASAAAIAESVKRLRIGQFNKELFNVPRVEYDVETYPERLYFYGGPEHGQFITLKHGMSRMKVPLPHCMDNVTYTRRVFAINGRAVPMMVCENTKDEEVLIHVRRMAAQFGISL